MTVESLLNAWPLMLIALVIGLALCLSLVGAVDAGTRFRLEWLGVFFVAVPLAMVVGVIVQHRTLGIELSEGGWIPELDDYLASNWASRILTIVCLALAIERAVRFGLRLEYRGAKGGALVVAFLVYTITMNCVAAALGTVPSFSHQLIYAPIFAVALYAYAQHNWRMMLPVVRNSLLAFLVVSLLCLAVRPSMVAETNYRAGLIPSMGLRFYGFATHPNTLAPLCFVMMCCLWLRPFRWATLQRLAWGIGWLCLLLTQSKTSLGLVALLVGGLWIRETVSASRLEGGQLAAQRRGLTLVATALGALAVVAVLALLAVLFNAHFTARVAHVIDNAQFVSLSGRTLIWAETLKVVRESPLFGYGPGLWGAAFRQQTGLLFTHAHNQYLQTLGAGGIVGLLALLGYLTVLLRAAWRVRGVTRGVSFALALYLVVRGLTEVPLSVSAAMQSEFLVQMFLLVMCVGALRSQVAPAAEAARARVPRFAPMPGGVRPAAG